jgi:hypothetical protein
MTNYQKLMKAFAGAVLISAFDGKSFTAWLIYSSTVVLLFALAHGFDAVYESLIGQTKTEG